MGQRVEGCRSWLDRLTTNGPRDIYLFDLFMHRALAL
jgi:hypothetical protein